MEVDVEKINEETKAELKALREIVTLDPISQFKVMRARHDAEVSRKLYIKENPTDIIEVDYTVADYLEHSLRFSALERSLARSYKEYISLENDGLGLEEYTKDFLKEKMAEKTR